VAAFVLSCAGFTGADVKAATPQPAPEMQTLTKALAGRWRISETFARLGDNSDAISTPKGGTGHGWEVWRSGPGGFTFMEEEHNFTPAGEVFIVGYMWWDATKKAFGGMECNSQWPRGCDLQSALSRVSVTWDGKILVVDFRSEKDPTKLAWHEVFSSITSRSFVQTADVGMPDGSLKRWATIHAVRVDEGARPQAKSSTVSPSERMHQR
jgi:hypothetical protein